MKPSPYAGLNQNVKGPGQPSGKLVKPTQSLGRRKNVFFLFWHLPLFEHRQDKTRQDFASERTKIGNIFVMVQHYHSWLRNVVEFRTWTFWLLLVRETGSWRSFLPLPVEDDGGWSTAKWPRSCHMPRTVPCPRCNWAMIVWRKRRTVFHRPLIHGTVHSAPAGDITLAFWFWLENKRHQRCM